MNNMAVLEQLPHSWQQQALIVSLIEQLSANYRLFTEVADFGESKVFDNILELAWEQLCGHHTKVDWQKQREKLEQVTPDPERFDGYGVWPALDACVALSELITLLAEYESADADAVPSLYYAGIEQYLQATGQQNVPEHPLYLQADGFIQELLELLIEPHASRQQQLKIIKAAARAHSCSNIGIEKN